MAVESIQRILTPSNISVVHIVTDSALEDVVQTGWLADQEESITEVNHGPFDWQDNDVLLINFAPISPPARASGSAFFYIFSDFESVNPIAPIMPNLQSIVAHAGGGQTDATQLNIGINAISVVATGGDSVKLPDDVLGQTVVVYNTGANSCDVFPFLGDSINSLAVNTAIALAAGSRAIFIGAATTRWCSFINP